MFVGVLGMGLLAGCGQLRYGGSSQDVVLAELREQNAGLREQVAQLTRERDELAVLASSRTGAASDENSSSVEVLRATPAPVSLVIDALSGVSNRDANGNGTAATIVIYVSPRDGRDRFVQVVGRLRVRAWVRDAERGEAEGSLLGERVLEPLAVRDAYRSGFAGTHYVVSMEVLPAMLRAGQTLVMRATLEDVGTGKSLEATRERVLR